MEEKETSVSGKEVVDSSTDYIAAIKELKQNSVDRSEYLKVKAENKKLLDAIVNGQEVDVKKPEKPKADIGQLRIDLFSTTRELSNLEYCSKALELRNSLIESGQPDPFIPVGKQITATDEDIVKAQNVADVLKQCIEYADGDSEVFTNELQRRTNDVRIR